MAAIAILILCCAALMSSCALIFQGSTEEVSVQSDPPGATVTLNSGTTYTTPFTMTVNREQDLELHFAKPGYQSVDISDPSHVEAGYLMIDSIPLLIPWAVDGSSGAGFEHQQAALRVHLDPNEGEAVQAPSQVSPSTK